MSGYDLVDIEVTHEAADDLLDSLSEDGAEESIYRASRLSVSKPANRIPNSGR